MRVEVGKSLQWLRKSRALTQYQLASLAQIDYRHYQNIESGRVEMKLDTLSRLCGSMSCDLAAFFEIVESQPWQKSEVKLRNFGNELYLFFLCYEQSRFTIYREVQDILVKWGYQLAQQERGSLDSAPFVCLELNEQKHVVWKNSMAREHQTFAEVQSLENVFGIFTDSTRELQKSFLDQIQDGSLRTCYYEALLTDSRSSSSGLFAFFSIKPPSYSEKKNLCLVITELVDCSKKLFEVFETAPDWRNFILYRADSFQSF